MEQLNQEIKVKSKAGRKPVKDKKESVTIYVKPSEIMSFGGKDALRTQLLNFIEKNILKSSR